MASSKWGTDRRLDESLFESGFEFDFFQVVRLLVQLHSERRKGASVSRPEEMVRFSVENTLSFPASAITSIIDGDNGDPSRVKITFLGMTGPGGVLPSAYTEIAVDCEAFGDTSYADFLDIFNHRLIWLFYRAWEKHHFSIGYERVDRGGSEQDALTAYLFDLIGMGTPGLKRRMPILDQALLRYAGLISQRPHSAESLRTLLHDYFRVPVEIEQLLGKWHALEMSELCLLSSGELNTQLGFGAIAGDAVWSRQTLLRITFGPVSVMRFRSFLPDGVGFTEAVALVRWFLGPALDFEVQPILASDEVPGCLLGDDTFEGPRLGWSSWLDMESPGSIARDAIFKEIELVRAEV
jgi:type VI secretion system protein ImpH